MAKAILIDTDNLDLAKLGEVFGTDVAEAIASAIGKEFNSEKEDLLDGSDDEDDSCDCEDCNCEDEGEEYSEYGECVTQDEDDYRFKVEFNLPGTDTDDISVVLTEEGFKVNASNVDGETFEQEVVTKCETEGKVVDWKQTSVEYADGVLTIRVFKTGTGPKAGDSIEVQAA